MKYLFLALFITAITTTQAQRAPIDTTKAPDLNLFAERFDRSVDNETAALVCYLAGGAIVGLAASQEEPNNGLIAIGGGTAFLGLCLDIAAIGNRKKAAKALRPEKYN